MNYTVNTRGLVPIRLLDIQNPKLKVPRSNSRPVHLKQLWVCWIPPEIPFPEDAVILSFLSPSIEEDLISRYPNSLISAREASQAVRLQAREWYVEAAARIGMASCGKNESLRQVLAEPGHASRWWYHPVAFKDCESSPIFNSIIAAMTISLVARQKGVEEIAFFGASLELEEVFRGLFHVDSKGKKKRWGDLILWLYGFASRLKFMAKAFWQVAATRRYVKKPAGPFDAIFFGFWDWSVYRKEGASFLEDRYFKDLPEELKQQGPSRVGWFAWFDPQNLEPFQKCRTNREVLAPLDTQKEVVILQSFLSFWDVLKAGMNLAGLGVFARICNHPEFRSIFRYNGMDFYSLFKNELICGFLNYQMVYCELVALAVERANDFYGPKVFLHFQEHFPLARACYEGVKRRGKRTISFAIQHASYNHEKTFLFLHPSFEFRGEPDGCLVPRPDYVCAMGTIAKELFLECGYPEDRVFVTGSPRFEVKKYLFFSKPSHKKKKINVLITTSLDARPELEMIEAVCAASIGIEEVDLYLRSHPFRPLDQHAEFARHLKQVNIRKGFSIEEDIHFADIIIFTYSTAAEEAFMAGVPVWQWIPFGFNGSALAEVVPIPRFSSVAHLRKALFKFVENPQAFIPSLPMRSMAVEKLFCQDNESLFEKIALFCAAR